MLGECSKRSLGFLDAVQVVPLANLIVKESLTEEDVLTCQKTVYNLVDMERKNDPLPISTVGSRGKGPKRYVFPAIFISWTQIRHHHYRM